MNARNIFTLAWEKSRGSFSLAVVMVCVTVFLAVAGLDLSGITARQTNFSILGLSYFGVFQRGWLFQFFTAPLMHANIGHLFFNMLSLWMLGPDVENALGKGRYIFFSVLCATASMLGFLLLNWGTGNVVMGYSGVIFGILVSQAVLFPDQRIALFAIFPIKMKYAAILLGLIELYLTVSPEKTGVANSAHLFGGVTGFLCLKAFIWSDTVKARFGKRSIKIPTLKQGPRKPRVNIPREL